MQITNSSAIFILAHRTIAKNLSAQPPYNETNLASLLAKGNETAFAQVYKKYWNKVFSIALVYLKAVPLAEDAVQEVFLKLWSSREQIAKVRNIEAFLFIIARNHVIDALKKNPSKQTTQFAPNDFLPDDLLLPPDQVDLKILQKKIVDAIESLPPQQKNVIKMSRELGLTHEQIANRLSIDKKTVKNHMVRALSTLRLILNDKETLILLLFLCSRILE